MKVSNVPRMTTTPSPYRVDVYRDGRWWMIRVPELDGYVSADGGRFPDEAITQAESRDEVEAQARDFIASMTDVEVSSVGLEVHFSE